jgi:aminoglycoside 6-adenylyltransferase
LNGSRANPTIQPDKLQDYDIVFMVTHIESFLIDHNWTNVFGEKLIWQLPNEMTFGEDNKNNNETIGFAYLILLTDGNRIDLSLFPIQKFKTEFVYDSLTIVWLDKDNLFPQFQLANDKDYRIQKPTEKHFMDTCNEFWWVSTYVAKRTF